MEYLGALITKHEVDPLDLFSSDELETLIKTASIRLPPRSLPPNSTLLSYHRRLLEVSLKETDPFFSFFVSLFFFLSFPLCVFVAWKCTHGPCRFIAVIFLCVRLFFVPRLRPCRQHYIEYLVELINQHKIDPLSIYEGSELIAQLRRMALDIPERLENETDAEFYGRCAQVNFYIWKKKKKLSGYGSVCARKV